jgi:ATP phosphoribosyltransferase regulatory subunit
MSDPIAALRALFADAGYGFIEPPVLHDASVFVEVAGEDLRRRMFLTTAADGSELALRPEYTIPVCVHHLATGAAGRTARYAYLGPVFRQRAGAPREFIQAGVESLGRGDATAADADILALALKAAEVLGVTAPAVRIGDSALFAAVLDALDLSEPWRRRLKRAFGDEARLSALIADAEGRNGARAAAQPDRDAIHAEVSALFAATGLAVIGARTADEIADRAIERAALARGIGATAAAGLRAFLAIAGDPAAASRALRAFAAAAGLDVAAAIDDFDRRSAAFAAHGIDLKRLDFTAGFGRRLDYYTGFVFEAAGGGSGAPLIGGGRYDGLVAHIPPPPGAEAVAAAVPAVGFAISLDRLAADA